MDQSDKDTEIASPTPKTEKPSSGRLLSLDVFRGIAILLMLLVNNIGRGKGAPLQLRHAGWSPHVHLADYAFPWFILIVGVAIPFSVASFRAKGLPTWKYDLRVIKRGVILFAIGCILLSIDQGRFVFRMGVLQLIAINYVIAAFLYDLPVHRRIALSMLLLATYWAAIKFVPIPGVGKGIFEEERNLIQYVNVYYLAPVRAAGLPVVIPTVVLTIIGTLIGDLIRLKDLAPIKKAIWMTSLGVGMIAFGELWSLSLEFNKPLWTSPFIMLTAGAGLVLLGVLYLVLDVYQIRKWAFPLIVFGSNAIVAYALPILFKMTVLRRFEITTVGLWRTLIFTTFWWAFCWLLYRKRWFIKI